MPLGIDFNAGPVQTLSPISHYLLKLMKSPLALLALGSVLASLFMAGCARPGQASQSVLHVYNWSDYIADGAVAQFEEQFNCRVVYDTYESTAELLAALEAGDRGYDVIFPSSDIATRLAAEGRLRTIDHDRIPNLAHIDHAFLSSVSVDTEMRYSVPYMVGATGIAVRQSEVGDFEPSWRIYERPDLAGRMTMINEMREVLGAALKTLGHSLNTTDPAQIEEAADLVIEWKHQLARFDSTAYETGLASGELLVVQGFSGDLQRVIEANRDADIVYVLPREGFSVWEDTMAIPAGADNVKLAEAFINFLHSPEVAAANTESTYYLCPNSAAYALLSEDMRANERVFLSAETFAQGEQIRDLGEDLALYAAAWERIQSAP